MCGVWLPRYGGSHHAEVRTQTHAYNLLFLPPPLFPSLPLFLLPFLPSFLPPSNSSCSDVEKSYLCSLNIVEDIITIMEMFRYDPGVISEAFGVIACLSNLPEFVNSIGRKGVHRQVSCIAPPAVKTFCKVTVTLPQNMIAITFDK